jgi:hypothetical protein
MKKAILPWVLSLIILCTNISVYAERDILVFVNGTQSEFSVNPTLIDGRVMVPMRKIFETLGANVSWDEQSQTVTALNAYLNIKMTVGNSIMIVNGKEVTLDAPPQIINSSTLVPVRAVAESFDANVQWSSYINAVVIGTKGIYAYADYPDVPDLGKYYPFELFDEGYTPGYKYYTYIYKNLPDIGTFEEAYDAALKALGDYSETLGAYSTIYYRKQGASQDRYTIKIKYPLSDPNTTWTVSIKDNTDLQTMYSLDGRTTHVHSSEVEAYKKVGWYKDKSDTVKLMYAPDGRTMYVYKSEVEAYQAVGWYANRSDVVKTLYARDGRTIEVYLSEVDAYVNVGWIDFDNPRDALSNNKKITKAAFDIIETGMSYKQVVVIIGGYGELVSQSSYGSSSAALYQWDGVGSIGANANVMFQNGKVTSKAQYGLK